jgi:hypothetical protein
MAGPSQSGAQQAMKLGAVELPADSLIRVERLTHRQNALRLSASPDQGAAAERCACETPERKALLLAYLYRDVGRVLGNLLVAAKLVEPGVKIVSERDRERMTREGFCGFERALHLLACLIGIAERP